ncbi:ShlB/FhaC/HecB family hemolysin secretion/activation protein [Lysobacter arvi]|uniref:ShlB/FhaC/HecB family hemolysin secretion/activation protein n=1 Tax=Lysobacter arvi TaxID=3038776 RepID=A0ABU1CEV7_9GAMM|nr:ShlB/FhaC/HecB family hemolysin secretion/activation protein [Lysobacter arvi]MDR0183485.1 ShlB/FhaC/HecB family hemolysin secretion/activation protein [Lysobacter arvi]
MSGRKQWMGVALALAPLSLAMAQVGPNAQELLRQQERERALREQQEQSPDVRLQPRAVGIERLPAEESPCFPIGSIVFEGEDADTFAWALEAANPSDDPALGRCLGTQGINVVMKRVQNAIVAKGYVTTRVLAAPQDLTSGTLSLTVIPGRVRAVRFAAGTDSRATWWNAVPAKPGDLLNLRDIEQALENFQRIPTVAADIQIVPAEGDGVQPGESDLVISWQQRSPFRFGLTLDDSGSESTGKLQGGATLSLDDWWMWNDLFYVNVGHDVFNGEGRGTESWTAHYDVPVNYWSFGATASGYDYRQDVAGPFETYTYAGSSENAELRAARMLFRNARTKIGAYGTGWLRDSKNFIDDTEIEVQRRRMAGWALGLTWKQFIGRAVLDADVGYKRGTGAFGALESPEEVGQQACIYEQQNPVEGRTPPAQCPLEGTSRPELITASAQLNVPFKVGAQQLRYTGAWRAQWNRTPLVPQDRFAIGGRYTVRGFDGELSIAGERGWTLQNTFALSLGGGQELYLGLDYGHVGGPSTRWQFGDELAGGVIGLRGGFGRGYWDVFFGAPIYQPDGFQTAYTTLGFSLGWQY